MKNQIIVTLSPYAAEKVHLGQAYASLRSFSLSDVLYNFEKCRRNCVVSNDISEIRHN